MAQKSNRLHGIQPVPVAGRSGNGRNDGFARRAMVVGAVAAILGLCLRRGDAAGSASSELDEVVSLVGDPDGYIDAQLHAQFRAAAAKVAADRDGAAEAARYAESFGDLALHKAHSEALWRSAGQSLEKQRVVRTAELDAVESAVRASEARSGRTRLSLYVEETPRMLAAAAKGSWASLDGRSHTFQAVHVAEMRGSVEARAHRLAALFQPNYAPPMRRWVAPGCPVGFDCDIAISYPIDEDNTGRWSYRSQITPSAYLAATIGTGRWSEPDDSVMKQSIELEVLVSKGRLIGEPDRAPFRGNPSARYEIEGGGTSPFKAGRVWLLPDRAIRVQMPVTSTASAADAKVWLDRMETALMLV